MVLPEISPSQVCRRILLDFEVKKNCQKNISKICLRTVKQCMHKYYKINVSKYILYLLYICIIY